MRGRKMIAIIIVLAMLIFVLPMTVMSEGDKTAEITIQYRDEEQNVIRENKVISETYNDGETYTVPDSLKVPFAVKVSDGYNLYEFNPGKSELTAPFAESMTITLVFNNTTQYAYYEDFEDYTVDSTKWKLGAGDLPVINDDHTNYVYHSTGSSTTSAYTKFDAVDTTGKKVQISFDTKLTTPNGDGLSQVSIANTSPSFSSNNVNYGVNSTSSGHILLLAYQKGSLTVNGTSASADFMDKWTHVEAEVDFGSKAATVTLSADGVTSQTLETKIYSSTFDSNIGMVYLRSGGANGAIAFDNFALKITGNASAVVPDIESVLNFKSVYAFGDSIVYGHNAPAKSFMRLIANDYAMDLNMLAKNGATIIKSDNWILSQIKNAPAAAPDFVVFDGYTNDAYESVMTNLGAQQGPAATTFDNTTFCGAFEETLYTMKQKWPDSDIVFITIHKSGGRDWDIQCKLRELSLEMCEAWGISVADIFKDTTLDTRNADEMSKYIINGAGSHPNEAACREFYIPVIVKTMEGIINGTGDEPAVEPTTEPTTQPTAQPTEEPYSEKVTKITADYSADGSLMSVVTELVSKSEVKDTVNTTTHKVFYWDNLDGMKPLAKTETSDGAIPASTDSAAYTFANYTGFGL